MVQKLQGYLLAAVLVGILLSSALSVPNFLAFADKGGKQDNDDKKKNEQNGDHDDQHKKPKKDPDKDKDNDRKECKHGDTTKNGKYRHNCDSEHDHF